MAAKSSRSPPPSAPNHAAILNKAELRVVTEWMDLGGQYFNNPFDAGVQAIAPLSLASFESQVFPIPDTMPDVEAAALHVTYQTGHLALHRRAAIRPGETLLVHAGAGGVGSAAIQLGLAAGARVLATAGGPEKVAMLRDLGVEVAIDYRDRKSVV